jgi:hypothetical protein
MTRAIAVGVLVVTLVVGTACGTESSLDSAAPAVDDPSLPTTSAACEADPTSCGVSFEELRDDNLRYADRLAFEGDPAEARLTADEVREALAAIAPSLPAPSEEQVADALRGWDLVVVSASAVKTAGTAFAVEVAGGCVFGSVHDGEVHVAVGGYVNDGGCLASYGH